MGIQATWFTQFPCNKMIHTGIQATWFTWFPCNKMIHRSYKNPSYLIYTISLQQNDLKRVVYIRLTGTPCNKMIFFT